MNSIKFLAVLFVLSFVNFTNSEKTAASNKGKDSKILQGIKAIKSAFESFQEFKTKFGKGKGAKKSRLVNFYRSDDDEEAHFKKFEKNLIKITKHNEHFQGKHKFELGVWDFSDFDEKEFRTSGLNGYKGRPKKRSFPVDFTWDNIPENLDYRALGYVTPIQFQGLCGSCWSFATVGAMEGQVKKATGVLTKLSEQSLIDCNRDETNGNWGCEGGNMITAFEFAARGGIVPTKAYVSYQATDTLSCDVDQNFTIWAKDWVELESDNEELLKVALANIGPIAVAVDSSLVTFQQYKSGIYDDPNCVNEPNHAVLLTGYGVDSDGKKFWTIKNSWGPRWGEGGYMRLERDAGNLCNIAFTPSYPILSSSFD